MHGARFGVFQVALGVVLLAAAAALSGPAWIVAWPALSVGLVGLGYLGLGPRVFGKRDDGSIALPHLVLLLPYHVVAWARLRWDALLRREDQWNEVAPGIFLGRRLTDHGQLPPGTRAVIDMTAEFRVMPGLTNGVEYRTLPTLDASAPEYAPFAELARWAASHQGPLYVHCAAGHGRSAALAAAVLVLRGAAANASSAEDVLKRARPLVHLHRPQRALVDRIATEVGSTS